MLYIIEQNNIRGHWYPPYQKIGMHYISTYKRVIVPHTVNLKKNI